MDDYPLPAIIVRAASSIVWYTDVSFLSNHGT